MKHIHFIFNPIAGHGRNVITSDLLRKYFDEKDYNVALKQSLLKKHAIKLTQESISEGAEIIVACGGDGTINEVASCIVNTNILLGIIPLGSGNGLASNLKIPKQIHKSLLLIKSQSVKTIDSGRLNNNFFFSNSGLGLSASVIKNYELTKTRKFIGYFKATLKSIKEFKDHSNIEIGINGETISLDPLIVFISNSNQMGYNVSLTPKASLQDGLLDVLVVSKLSTLKILLFSVLMLFRKHNLLKEVKSFQSNDITISQTKKQVMNTQIDGESLSIDEKTINLTVLQKSLHVIA